MHLPTAQANAHRQGQQLQSPIYFTAELFLSLLFYLPKCFQASTRAVAPSKRESFCSLFNSFLLTVTLQVVNQIQVKNRTAT